MSGIIGFINLDREPVSEQLLSHLTKSMSFRGPDGEHVWIDRHVGFGHAVLNTSDDPYEKQPLLIGHTCINADARIDGRRVLIDELRAAGCPVVQNTSDVELILRAYSVWKEECTQHLIGDFAFAIWDDSLQQLFCARDHFGTKPFYYFYKDQNFVFSNTYNCLLQHPVVSPGLNDKAIGDYLLFGFNMDQETTMFSEIQRIPPAHSLVVSESGLRFRKYWQGPQEKEIRYRRDQEYVEHFRRVFSLAVEDRLRTNRIGVAMSGGMDSTSVAVTAKQILEQKYSTHDLRAFTLIGEKNPDPEKTYSKLVSEYAGIPIEYLNVDQFTPFQGWETPYLKRHYPLDSPLAIIAVEDWKRMLGKCKVVLMGSGGDGLLVFTRSYFLRLLKSGQYLKAASQILSSITKYGKLPPLRFRTALKRKLGLLPDVRQTPFPPWIQAHFETRYGLRQRWIEYYSPSTAPTMTNSDAFSMFTSAEWTSIFEDQDPGVTRIPIESRQPYFDARLIDYIFSIPLVPWCIQKHILRVAMEGMLPKEVLNRPKTILTTDPLAEALANYDLSQINHFDAVPELSEYVNVQKIPRIGDWNDAESNAQLLLKLRPFSLNYWFREKNRLGEMASRRR